MRMLPLLLETRMTFTASVRNKAVDRRQVEQDVSRAYLFSYWS
jgi:hypothetical protein